MADKGEQQAADREEAATHAPSLGIAGRMTREFIHSPLSPILFIAMLALGLLGLVFTPRQEDPQISVPMVDIFVQMAGSSAEQVASLAIDPLERIMSEIPGVKHVYSASRRGQGMVTVRFKVGEQLGPSLVKVYDKLASNMDKMPPGVSQPLVKPKGIDDVPVVTLTLWSDEVDDGQLRALALDVLQNLKQVQNTGQGFIVGGRAEQIRVEVLPERLSGFNISLDQVANAIHTANSELNTGNVEVGDTHFTVYSGSFLKTAEDVQRLVVGTHHGSPVYVRDIARVFQAPEESHRLVTYYTGPAFEGEALPEGIPAVTIALAKKEGSNGVTVANAILDRVESLKGHLIPDNVEVALTRNYGKTADEKVNELIFKLFIATAAVALLVWWALGVRPAMVVLAVIPVVILITVFSAWLLGFTIDRVSLFALIFSIGILVDDAIVVVENIYRRWLLRGETDTDTAVDAVREVGNPTILATFTVVAALMPMGFVSGMMGPYMAPIPALGSVAMIFSLIAAFAFTPWLAMRIKPSLETLHKAEVKEHAVSEKLEGLYRRLLLPLINSKTRGRLTLLAIFAVFFACLSMFYTTAVTVKMLPFDNKAEFSVVIDLPEGTALPVTANLTERLVQKLREVPEVTALQSYVGTAMPFDFNGMVRHYYLREQAWQADIHVQLLEKGDRKRKSHDIAASVRDLLTPLAREVGARIAIVEMPPGPPVLQSVVAEIYGPDAATRRKVADDMSGFFGRADRLADVDNYMEESHEAWRFDVDTEKAIRRGISVDVINRNLAMAMGGYKLGDVKQGSLLEPTYIVMQVPLGIRAQINRLYDLPIPTGDGGTVPLAELGHFVRAVEDPIIYHKDLRAVEYVVADAVGRLGAPVYGMSQVKAMLTGEEGADEPYVTPDGVVLAERDFWMGPPPADGRSGFEWTGEWTVTYETFRDMGLAFGAALVLIYILVVWEFGNFTLPAIIMAPIPLTLIGIIPGHWLVGVLTTGNSAEFTATSMIGFIALAGIIVRNSILLVDFSMHEVARGTDVRDAVILACKTRTRPIVITALALVLGSSVILFDPIFQGMAISLLFGVLVSTLLTLLVIPLGCISAKTALCPPMGQGDGAFCAAGCHPTEAQVRAEREARRLRRGSRATRFKVALETLYHVIVALVVQLAVAVSGFFTTVVIAGKNLLRRITARQKVDYAREAFSPVAAAAATEVVPDDGAEDEEVTPAGAPAAAVVDEPVKPVDPESAAKGEVAGEVQPAVSAPKRVSAAKRGIAKKSAPKKVAPKKAAPKKAATKKRVVTKKAAPANPVAKRPATAKADVKPAAPKAPPVTLKGVTQPVVKSEEPAVVQRPIAVAKKKGKRRGIRLKGVPSGDSHE